MKVDVLYFQNTYKSESAISPCFASLELEIDCMEKIWLVVDDNKPSSEYTHARITIEKKLL